MSSGELVADHKPAKPACRADLGQLVHDGRDVPACFIEVRPRFFVQIVDVSDQNGYGSQGTRADDAQSKGGEQSDEDKSPAEPVMRVFHVISSVRLRVADGRFPDPVYYHAEIGGN